MFEWFKKKKEDIEEKRDTTHYISQDGNEILNLWLQLNEVNSDTFDDLIKKLDLIYPYSLSLHKKSISIADHIWEENGYIGSIEFEKEVFPDYNATNKYSKIAVENSKQRTIVNHTLHLCKDGIIVETNYSFSDITREESTCRYREFFKMSKDKDNKVVFTKQKDTFNISTTSSSFTYRNERSYKREQTHDNIIQITLIDNVTYGPGKVVIQLNKHKDDVLNFQDEYDFARNLWCCDFNKPGVVLKKITQYCEKYNLDIPFVNISTVKEGYKVTKNLLYENYKSENQKKTSIIEHQDNSKSSTSKRIFIHTEYENDMNCRIIEIETSNKKSMVLKAYMKGEESTIPNEEEIISYLLMEFPRITLVDQVGWDQITETYFYYISNIAFKNPSENLQKVELTRYENDKEVDSKVWKRHNLEEDAAVLKRK